MKYAHCFVVRYFGFIIVLVVFMSFIFPYSSGLLYWHWGNDMIALVAVKQPLNDLSKIGQYQTATKHIKT